MRENKNGIFKSKWGFILACVGSAVGMANVWGFPYKVGSNGGGAFLIAYLFFIILFGNIGLAAEYAIGRRSGTGTLGAYAYAWSTRKKKGFERVGKIVGWIPLAGSMCIAIGYAVIVSYVLKAFTQAVDGTLMSVKPDVWFGTFAFNKFSVIVFHALVIAGTLLTLIFGANSIEKTNKIMMPLFFILFLILAVRVATLPGVFEGYKFLFKPDWSLLLKPWTWIWAMGQAFFSLSITGSGMIVYGAYLDKKEDIVKASKNTALFDTIAAFVAALVMIPACFAYNLEPGGGPGLLFVSLPTVLQNMPGGRIFAVILFVAVVFAGISSLQNMFEAVGESLMHVFPKLKRVPMLSGLLIVCFGVGVFMEPIAETEGAILGGWGPWMDLVSIYIIPIGATIGAVSWFWIMKKEDLMDEINKGAGKIHGDLWYGMGKWLYTPLAAILCIIALSFGISF